MHLPHRTPWLKRQCLTAWRTLGLLLLALGIPSTGTTAQAASEPPLQIAVAGNFVPALERLLDEHPASAERPEVRLSSGSTGKLFAQLRQGAPFDVFLSADADRPRRLEAEGVGIAGSRVSYVRGRLVLWAPEATRQKSALELLAASPPPRLALANPRLAPYGVAAEAWLRQRGQWNALSDGALRGESVAQAFHFVATGNADLGLVAWSQLRLSGAGERGAYWLVPAAEHPPIDQQALLVRESPRGRQFLQWLLSPPVQSRLRELGYDSP